jgi:hypothetical protein
MRVLEHAGRRSRSSVVDDDETEAATPSVSHSMMTYIAVSLAALSFFCVLVQYTDFLSHSSLLPKRATNLILETTTKKFRTKLHSALDIVSDKSSEAQNLKTKLGDLKWGRHSTCFPPLLGFNKSFPIDHGYVFAVSLIHPLFE